MKRPLLLTAPRTVRASPTVAARRRRLPPTSECAQARVARARRASYQGGRGGGAGGERRRARSSFFFFCVADRGSNARRDRLPFVRLATVRAGGRPGPSRRAPALRSSWSRIAASFSATTARHRGALHRELVRSGVHQRGARDQLPRGRRLASLDASSAERKRLCGGAIARFVSLEQRQGPRACFNARYSSRDTDHATPVADSPGARHHRRYRPPARPESRRPRPRIGTSHISSRVASSVRELPSGTTFQKEARTTRLAFVRSHL